MKRKTSKLKEIKYRNAYEFNQYVRGFMKKFPDSQDLEEVIKKSWGGEKEIREWSFQYIPKLVEFLKEKGIKPDGKLIDLAFDCGLRELSDCVTVIETYPSDKKYVSHNLYYADLEGEKLFLLDSTNVDASIPAKKRHSYHDINMGIRLFGFDWHFPDHGVNYCKDGSPKEMVFDVWDKIKIIKDTDGSAWWHKSKKYPLEFID